MTVLPMPLWAAFLVALIICFPGCATQEDGVWHRVCHEQLLGQDERGMYVVRHFCVRE